MVRRSDQPVWGLIDARNMTAFVFQKIFGPARVRHDAVTGIVYVGPCRAEDMEVFTDHSHALELRRSRSTVASWSIRSVARRVGGFVPEGPLDGSGPASGTPAGGA